MTSTPLYYNVSSLSWIFLKIWKWQSRSDEILEYIMHEREHFKKLFNNIHVSKFLIYILIFSEQKPTFNLKLIYSIFNSWNMLQLDIICSSIKNEQDPAKFASFYWNRGWNNWIQTLRRYTQHMLLQFHFWIALLKASPVCYVANCNI